MAFKSLLISIAVIAYTWVIFPLMLCALSRLFPRSRQRGTPTPDPFVSIIVSAHNEQDKIAAKLEDCLELLYPHGRLEIIVASDCSMDQTGEIVSRFSGLDSRIRWIESDSRVGKSGVQNLAAEQARGEILLFTDSDTQTRPALVQQIVEDFADPEVGLVAPVVQFGRFEDAVSKGQGFYWRFELLLRQLESDLGILATASGAAFAVRRSLYRPIPLQYGDDCIVPLDVRLQGYKVMQDREAIVSDAMPHSIEGELRARIRMTARNWTGILARPAIFNPLRFPCTALGLISHKLLRWLTPFFLMAVFLSNALLAMKARGVVLWWLQVGFYISAFVGWELTRKQRSAWLFGLPFSFCLANIGFLLGMVKAVRNQKVVAY